MSEALERQAAACEALGSVLYCDLLRQLRRDFDHGGRTFDILHGTSERPLHDATPLRLLAAVHRIVLSGRASQLAARYPSAGGDGASVPVDAFLDVVEAHRGEVAEGLRQPVQTNEVGRAGALVVGFAEVARRWGWPLRIRELGASAGLILRWDHFAYDTGTSCAGDPASPVQLRRMWLTPPDLSGLTPVVDRRGCDLAPIDTSDPAQRLRLLSFVWPDQSERFARLQAALTVAERVPACVDRADAGAWLSSELADPAQGLTTVVYHSIVWQYLNGATRDAVRSALLDAGRRATADAPLAWLRLEPAGDVADLRITTWPGGDEAVLATSGYHGFDVVVRAHTSAR